MNTLTLGQIKQAHRQAKRQNAKARRKLETIMQLRQETAKIDSEIFALSDVLAEF